MRRLEFSTAACALASLLLLAGCGSHPAGPPKDEVIKAVQSRLPDAGYLHVTDVTYESLPDTQQAGVFDIKAKGTVTTSENLCSQPVDAEVKQINAMVGEYNAYIEWINHLLHSPAAASVHGVKQLPFTRPPFVHVVQKSGEKFTCYGKFLAEHEVDRWKMRTQNFDWEGTAPVAPISSFPAGSIGLNTPEGEAALAKLQGELDAVHKFRADTTKRLVDENQAFAASISKWLTASTPFSGLYQDQPFAVAQVTPITVQFSDYDPAALTCKGQITYPSWNAVMSFVGTVQDATLNLHDMQVLKGQISADPAWVLKLAADGNLKGYYPTTTRGNQPVVIHPN